jgi:hypothetical protein
VVKVSSPRSKVKFPAPGNIHRYDFLKQMLQLQAVAVLTSGTLTWNLTAPQWQFPWYVLSSGADIAFEE